MLEKCSRGMQESEVVGGWPAVAVGYALEGTIRFRTCPRFPARGDWFLMRRTSCPGVSESAHPSGDVDDGNRMASQMESGLQASTWRYDTRWPGPVSGQSLRVPSSYRLSIGESLIGLPSLAARE